MSSCGCHGDLPCGCCTGIESVTPESEFNRPGLPAIRYRAGTFATFFETMEADLSKDRRLDNLSTRETSDASIAFLDAWATVGDVLTLYQERIANEGYIGTATERRSAAELANLVGYTPRPGVSASTFVAYTLDAGAVTDVPAGSLVRSVPAPGETQQAFETKTTLSARAPWNNLQVRLTRPHSKKSILTSQKVYLKGIVGSVKKGDPLFVQFARGDAVLCRVLAVNPDNANARTEIALEEWTNTGKFRVIPGSTLYLANRFRVLQRVEDFGLKLNNATVKGVLPIIQDIVSGLDADTLSDADLSAKQTDIDAFAGAHPPRLGTRAAQWLDLVLTTKSRIIGGTTSSLATVDDIATKSGLQIPALLSPASEYNRSSDLQLLFDAASQDKSTQPNPTHVSGAALATLAAFRPALAQSFATGFANAVVTPDPVVQVYAVARTAPFGYNAGPRASTKRDPLDDSSFVTSWTEWPLDTPADGDGNKALQNKLDLEKEFDKIDANPLVAIQVGAAPYTIPDATVTVSTVARAAYGLSGKSTQLAFSSDVLPAGTGAKLSYLRPIKVFLATDLIPLAEQPITNPVCGSDAAIELDGLYDGLTPGRWMILTGERQDTLGTSGIQATELLLIGDVQHQAVATIPGERIHTFIKPTVASSYCYKRDTVKIYGNVVDATNGETRKEILGGGNAATAFQQFVLKQPPLTYLSAPTANGSQSTLHVYVNDVEWHEVDSPVGLPPYARKFFTKTADDGTTRVIFGNGIIGSRVPTGNTNVRAAYRNGIGKGGNVTAGQLSILGTKPLGVKEVINPMRASGGADKDTRDQIRVNAPLSVTALDRLVSVEDYADFARVFAGIGKSSSAALTDGSRQLVHVTIAGIDDIPIDASSDLYLNLRHALHLYGDPNQPLQLDVRTAKFLVVQAGVRVDPDYPWETVAPKLTAALLDAFSFERRELGQSAFLSEVLYTLQSVPGVIYVDADKFGFISESQLTPSGISQAIASLKLLDVVPANIAQAGPSGVSPAEIAYFSPDVSTTIALNQIEDAT